MLSPYLGTESNRDGSLQADLGSGAPTVMAFARLSAQALLRNPSVEPDSEEDELSLEAQAILYTARRRGIIEVKAAPKEFNPADRFLTVYVEEDTDRIRVFRDSSEPRNTVRYLEAFAQICRLGLTMHHLAGEFSLTERGFRLAQLVPAAAVESIIERLRVVERGI
ncbi:MAG TPA: hypothetical protein VGN57_02345 [Pirellulaceae bacterium]|jgi:hypothetical protein|nr:hypothetical protein [Pirellulaceae bacterium]